MLLKGIAEVQAAGRPLAAAEMVLVRIAYAADLPTPDEVIRSLGGAPRRAAIRRRGSGAAAASAAAPANAAPPSAPRYDAPRGTPRAALAPRHSRCRRSNRVARSKPPADAAPAPRVIGRFEDLIALAAEKRDLAIKAALERDVRLVRCEDGRLEIALEPSAPKTLVSDLSRKLSQWTGRRWMVVVSAEAGRSRRVKAQNETRQAELKDGVRADPLVQAVLARFPGAEIVDVRGSDAAAAAGRTAVEDDDIRRSTTSPTIPDRTT